METMNTAADLKADRKDDVIRIEVIHAGSVEAVVIELPPAEDPLAALRLALAIEEDVLIFERDQDEALTCLPPGRKALRLVTHKAHTIELVVHYDHLTHKKHFAPAKTVFKALQWAVSDKAFNLDPTVAPKANLILPGAEEPLPREASLGSFIPHGHHVLEVNLTLRDFTNGHG
jgi:hypothetical protein